MFFEFIAIDIRNNFDWDGTPRAHLARHSPAPTSGRRESLTNDERKQAGVNKVENFRFEVNTPGETSIVPKLSCDKF